MITAAAASALNQVDGVRHGFVERTGGVSNGIYASLNCGRGSDDDSAAVTTNRRRVAAKFGIDEPSLLTLYQIHSARVELVSKPWAPADAPRADAMVTTKRGIGLGILTADCAPVLFADLNGRVVGCAHAGWRGAFGGVLENTVEEMINQGADKDSILASIGPCISQAAYEVGADFRSEFVMTHAAHERFFVRGRREGHWQFDLVGFVETRLRSIGVHVSREAALCTYENDSKFFSYRRTTHQGEEDYGRQISVIMLADDDHDKNENS